MKKLLLLSIFYLSVPPFTMESAFAIAADEFEYFIQRGSDDKVIELGSSELKEMKKILDYLVSIFKNPAQGDIEKINRKREKMLEEFKGNARYNRATAYFHLVRFLEIVTDPRSPNPERACIELNSAVKAFDALYELGYQGEEQAKKVYSEDLGIDATFIRSFYETEYAKNRGFLYRQPCPCTELNTAGHIQYEGTALAEQPFHPSEITGTLPEAPSYRTLEIKWQYQVQEGGWIDIPNSNKESYTPGFLKTTTAFRRAVRFSCQESWQFSNTIEIKVQPPQEEKKRPLVYDTIYMPTGMIIMNDKAASYQGYNGETREADNVIQLLRKLVNYGSFNTDLFEIRQLVEGDNRWIPGQNGIPYELTFKHEETFSTILFPIGEYVISDLQPDGKWDPYRKSMNMISTCVIRILDQFGGSSFLIMTQGRADAPTFSPKPLVKGYDNSLFSDIPIFSYDENGMKSSTVNVGTHYTNDELPDLRAAFLANAILKRDFMRIHQEKVFMLKGWVTSNTDPKDRNASIVIWIDWDEANKVYHNTMVAKPGSRR